jgi:mannose-6-phosphate isomerase-like protein (cupin superfamily)
MIHWALPAQGSSPPMHVHHHDDELWYVVEGRLLCRIGDRETETTVGGTVVAPHGVPHAFWNPGPQVTRCLTLMTTRTLRLLEELEETPYRSLEVVQAIFRKYDGEFLSG